MGLFSKLVGKKEVKAEAPVSKAYADSSSIDADERPYYQADEYYTCAAHQGTPFEKRVITFDERKAISYPSSTGLYVAEDLLLEYCSYGTYPKPKNGYPGFWWFEYGIRDVGNALKSLLDRGYIQYDSAENTIKRLTVAELKAIAEEHDIPVKGKKDDILKTVLSALPSEEIEKYAINRKYRLTEKGAAELQENAYIPYMHKHKNKTIEGSQFGDEFNVWSINKLLKGKNVSEWREVVGAKEEKLFGENMVKKETL